MSNSFVESILQLVAIDAISEDNAYSLIKAHQSVTGDQSKDIAIIGISCRFPQAGNKEEFWHNVASGMNSIRPFPSARMESIRPFLGEDDSGGPYYQAGYLDEIDFFDAEFFNILPGEAQYMDPQQRIFMETGYEAIEDAGYGGERIRNADTGVYVGFSEARYKDMVSEDVPAAFVGNFPPVVASRLSYALNLSGPAVSIATACSSSLVALHLACEGLHAGDCSMALVGGVAIGPLPAKLENGSGLGITSIEGKSRSFDASANGTAWGEGCGAVLIKPLKQAEADGDYVYAVIKGSAINQDGTSNGMASPNALAQEEVLVKAWNRAGIDPLTISYIEAHGTGTKIGDPIEIKGLTNAFRKFSLNNHFCGVGSVKSNIGHLDSASGIAGLIKTVMAMQKRLLPPSIHFVEPNPLMSLQRSPVYINTRLKEWSSPNGQPLRAGVSSFGLSGTNCHVVLEEFQPRQTGRRPLPLRPVYIFPLSARNEASLRRLIGKYIEFISDCAEPANLEEICAVLSTGREHHACRLAILAADPGKLLGKLRQAYCAFGSKDWLDLRQEGVYSSLCPPGNPLRTADSGDECAAVARAYAEGGSIQWMEFYPQAQYAKRPLPTYAWERTRHWVEAPTRRPGRHIQENLRVTTEVRLFDGGGFPPTEEEYRMAQLWGKVLGLERLDVTDDFFQLGGDSLLATDLINRIRGEFGAVVNMAQFFQFPSIRGLAGLLTATPEEDAPASGPAREYYPLSHAQRRLFVLNQLAGQSLNYNMPGAAIITGPIDVQRFKDTFAQLIRRHESFRTVFDVTEDEIVQCILPDADFRVQYDAEPATVRPEDILRNFIQPFQLEEAPLLRVGLFRLRPQEGGRELHLFLFDMHHIISDGVSMEILMKEFSALYLGHSLPALQSQYKDYVLWQSAQMHSDDMRLQEAYWRRMLAEDNHDKLPVLDMPHDFPRPPIMTFEGDVHCVTIPSSQVDKLKALALEHGATLYMMMLAVYSSLLHIYTGQEEVVIGSLMAGRRYQGSEQMIGLFTNYLPLRCSPAGSLRFKDLLKAVVRQTVEAYDHQDYPFEQMVDLLKQKRDLSRNPIFDTMLILHNQGTRNQSFELDSIKIGMMDWERTACTLDLKLDLFQGSQGELNCSFEFYKRLFHKESIVQLAGHFLTLVEQIVNDPERRLSEYRILTLAEAVVIERKRKVKHGLFQLPPLERVKTSGKGPLSLRQRMIVRNREAINNVVVHVLLHGEVQQDALARALEIFHRKTPGARIVLQEDERGHRQAVLESSSPGLAISPIPGDSNVDQLISVLLLEEIRHRFDLSSGPLYRVTMLQDSKELNHVILTVHPFIAECLAVSRMLSDILHIYREPTDVLTANLPVKLQEGDTTCDTEIQETAYALSFASWQQSLLHEGYLEPQRPYWTRALRHPLPRFEFRLKRGGKEQAGTRLSWSHTGIILPPKTLGLLHSYAAPYGADVTVLLLSCYIMLLRQLTQAEDILVGTLMNGSAQTRESGLPFIYQTLSPLRLSLQHSTSFGALLGQVKQEVEAGRSSMLYPYDLQWVNAGKIAESKETLYQVLFAEEEWPLAPEGLRLAEFHQYMPEEALLKLAVAKSDEGLQCTFYWDDSLLEADYIRSMAQRYHKIIETLAQSVTNPKEE